MTPKQRAHQREMARQRRPIASLQKTNSLNVLLQPQRAMAVQSEHKELVELMQRDETTTTTLNNSLFASRSFDVERIAGQRGRPTEKDRSIRRAVDAQRQRNRREQIRRNESNKLLALAESRRESQYRASRSRFFN